MSALPDDDALARGFLAGALAALRKRAAARRKSASDGTTLNERGVTIATAEAVTDLSWAADWAAIADEIEAEARQ